MTIYYIIGAAIITVVVLAIGFYLVLNAIKSSNTPELLEQKKDAEIAELHAAVQQVTSEKNEFSGKNKEMFARNTQIEAELRSTTKEKDELRAKLAKHEAERERYIAKQEDLIQKQDAANQALIQERQRIVKTDEEQKALIEADRDRIWNEHEQNAIAQLRDACKQPQLGFETFENTNLPEGFHGSFKPDFLVSFLNQYIVFDAKVSKSGNMQTYINTQVKTTVDKIKKSGLEQLVYSSLFLVIPHFSLLELKKTIFYEEGFNVFIVSTESLLPLLHSFKKIEQYEFAEQMDPMERENIIDLIAQFDFHISSRNAVDFALMQHGLETLGKTKQLASSMTKEVEHKKSKMRTFTLAPSEQKKLVQEPEDLKQKLQDLVEPAAKIEQESIPGFTSKPVE